ncbi:MAG: flavodoxin-dependent (E)-4-hydroxy-3-methylbut-2-enyl-diphosphate synthase [Candidatus Omnitrophica bacterium]|nr:flavodoxin-dependent (E)-4-hydroxy-3-methylbut-2-enyl-diphosphate synthase [Candidatus Omnitrophota bacterium]MDE2221960.1 flavodoxin-dependent (E)-4-hydroxy-3-methylbut-2-enyl-diphosphate synthase [Candidatus Omnitrophota bacterium]
MGLVHRRKTSVVQIGSLNLGSDFPVRVQSMTDTPTSDVQATLAQTRALIAAGSELVRWTVNDDAAAKGAAEAIRLLREEGINTPIIGDFHFNGHILLRNNPRTAQRLDKYRINPGNVGKGRLHDDNFAQIVKIAIDKGKAVRIGVNWGSLDQELLTELMDANARSSKPKDFSEVTREAMVQSALRSAEYALKLGLPKTKLVLSVKMSVLQDMVAVYERLAAACDCALHLGLTEAGADIKGAVSSAAALSILLQQGIGDTIRVSLTPQPKVPRSKEVEVCKELLQSMGFRYFAPSVTSCPGCGRTASNYFQYLAQDINSHIKLKMPLWQKQYPGVEEMKIAVMGCVVNGPGESRHADIGISLPGSSEKPIAPVYMDGKEHKTLKGDHIKEEFIDILEDYIKKRYGKVSL